MKKKTMHTIVFGSAALTAATAGAWFMLSSEPAPPKTPVPTLPSADIEKNAQVKNEPSLPQLPDASPVVPDPPNDPLVDSSKSLLENALLDNPAEKPSEDKERVLSEQDEPMEKKHNSLSNKEEDASSQEPSKSDFLVSPSLLGKGKTESTLTETPSSVITQGNENELPQDISTSPRQQAANGTAEPPCKEVTPLLSNFLNKVEDKGYSKDTEAKQSLQEHFNNLATQLTKNPPVVTHETDDLYTVLTNTAHFFRILGKDNMQLLQKVLKQNSSDFEAIAAEIYQTSTGGDTCVSGKETLEIPFTAAYEYAGFFLNTLGGRSYLFRRDPGTRLLVNYYAVLILDQANKRHMNSYGLDIREQLPWLIQEMEASNRLSHKEKYLDKLYELSEEYQALP
ncbi:MAG: hypothetical protein SD837_15300 [Candidatus Electrothrix scaldis]|nr:MAG: hypothetical protein SD837_15300 [Candidatus Electrothrix sp. GW3-3]